MRLFLLFFFFTHLRFVCSITSHHITCNMTRNITREEQTFAEAVLDILRRAEDRRTKSEQVEEDGGAFPGNPRHPVGWVGT